MSLFSKIEVKPEMEPFIKKGEGVGVVKISGYGKASARIESHKIILESYDEDYPIIESISAISVLSYDPGNFFQEPKLGISFGEKEYTLAGVDNNDEELEAFYQSILNLKKSEKNQKTNSVNQEASKDSKKLNEDIDELNEVEKELDHTTASAGTTNKIKSFLSKKHSPTNQDVKDTESKEDSKNIKDFLTIKSKKSEDLESVLEENDQETTENNLKTKEETISSKEQADSNNQPNAIKTDATEKQEKSEIELIEESDEFDEFDAFEDFDDDEEIILEDDNEFDELVVEDEEDDELVVEDEEDEELIVEDEEDTEVIVEEVDETDDTVTVEDEEDLIIEERTEKPEKTKDNNNITPQSNPQENKKIIEKTTENTNIEKSIKSTTNQIQEVSSEKNIIEKDMNKSQNDLKEEISNVKDEINDKINNINQEISNQGDLNQTTTNTFDPVYQIRRYYELKEDGIITEEEFEQKKKQLLDL